MDGHFNFISRKAVSSQDVLLPRSVMQTIDKTVINPETDARNCGCW